MEINQLNELLKIENFQAYMESQDPEEIAGKIGISHSCPIAQYLKKETGKRLGVTAMAIRDSHRILIGRTFGQPEPEQHELRLPDWVNAFVINLDYGDTSSKVTFRQALQVLEKVKTETIAPKTLQGVGS